MTLYYDAINGHRLSEALLRQRVEPSAVDLASVGIHPLDTTMPAHDPLTHRLEDCGTAGDPASGYRIDWQAVPHPVEAVRRTLCDAVAARRWAAEVGGCTADGMVLHTDRDSQAKLTGAALEADLSAREGRPYAVRWLMPEGFVELDGPTVIALARAVRAHVQRCFDRQAELCAAIAAAATVGDLAAIAIDAGWPAAVNRTAPPFPMM